MHRKVWRLYLSADKGKYTHFYLFIDIHMNFILQKEVVHTLVDYL